MGQTSKGRAGEEGGERKGKGMGRKEDGGVRGREVRGPAPQILLV